MGYFLAELKRRKVYRVAVVYVIVGAGIWAGAEVAFPALNLPPWCLTLVVVLTLIGFPIALVLAWAYEVKPEEPGVTEEAPAPALFSFLRASQADGGRFPHSVQWSCEGRGLCLEIRILFADAALQGPVPRHLFHLPRCLPL